MRWRSGGGTTDSQHHCRVLDVAAHHCSAARNTALVKCNALYSLHTLTEQSRVQSASVCSLGRAGRIQTGFMPSSPLEF